MRNVVQMRPPVNKSDHILETGYDEESGVLTVTFRKGGTYDYPNVPEDIATELHLNQSAGSYFARAIRPKFKARKRGK